MLKPLLRLMGGTLLGVLAVASVAPGAYAAGPNVATFYQNSNFNEKDSGYSKSLAEGKYNTAAMVAAGIKDEDISSLKVIPGFKVICYKDDNFSGEKMEVTADMGYVGADWNDRISSLEIVPNGVSGLVGPVRFKNVNSGLFLDAKDNDVTNGKEVCQYAESDNNSQNWILKEVSPGVYNITSYQSHTTGLDCRNAGTGNNTVIQLNGVTDDNQYQQFIIYDRPEGDYQLVSRSSGRVIEVPSSKKDAGVTVNLYDNNGSFTQQWSLQAPSITELYLIGGADGIGWDINNAQPLTKLANGVFVYRNAQFTVSEGNQGFKILTGKDWNMPAFMCGGDGQSAFELTAANYEAPCNWYANTSGPNFDVTVSGTYDITVDLNTHKLSLTPSMPEITDLFIIGHLHDGDWDAIYPGRRYGNRYVYENVKVNGSFQFLINGLTSKWNWEQRLAANPYNGDDVKLTPGTAAGYTYLSESFKPKEGKEPNFLLDEGTYTIYVDLDAHTVMAAKYENPEITSVYLYGGNIDGKWWTPTGEAEKDGSKFTFRNVFVNDQYLQFVVNGTDVRYRLCPGPYGADNVALDQCENNTARYAYVSQDNNPLGVGEPSFTLPVGQYDITVDTAAGTVTVTRLAEPAVNELYLIGNSVNGFSWNPDQAVKGERNGNVIKFNQVCIDGDFHFLVDARSWNVRLFAGQYGQTFGANNDTNMNIWYGTENQTAPYNVLRAEDKPKDVADPHYWVPRGVYDVTVNLDNHTVSVAPHAGDMVYTNFDIKFWEGPIYKALKEKNPDLNTDTFLPFTYYGMDTENGHNYEIYELKVADNIDPITYVSQMSIKGEVFTTSCTYNASDRSFTFDDSKTAKYALNPAYFDAHTPDVLVPVTTDFWCNNSRMEVGITAKSIYIYFDRNSMGKPQEGISTPVYILASSDGEPKFGAPVQRPLNSDSYSITLTGGALYDALKGTQTGPITVPFARHHAADGAFSINLGRYVTTGAEGFTFNVNDRAYEGGGFVFGGGDTNTLISPQAGSGSALPSTPLTFNRIILMVGDKDGGKYNDYKLYLANGELPEGFEKFGGQDVLPMLKVWRGLDYVTTQWSELFYSDVKYDIEDGDVRYYKFQPVLSDQGNQTNLYYLDLSNGGKGVKVSEFREKVGDVKGHYDQFNIVDNNGYDISTPYQGSQLMYTGQWWCANPNLVVDDEAYNKMSAEEKETLRDYNGLRFKPVQKTDSRVDLCWNENATIYGISLFKIMGHGYDVYADAVIERPLYYLYAHTEPRSGDVKAKVEKTAPILFELKAGSQADGWTEYSASDKYTTALDADKKYFVMTRSAKTLGSNDDLNYLLTEGDFTYEPKNDQPFEFVDVTGDQRWTATGESDKLRPNIWSNYYTGLLSTDKHLTLLDKDAKYFKVVLATNPDQTRYQVMSLGISILPEGELKYDSHHGDSHNPQDLLIYPTTDVSGSFYWKKGATELTVTLHFVDKDNKEVTTDVKVTKEQAEANKLPDQDGFFDEGEFTFSLDLGKYCTNPDWDVYATAEFDNGGDIDPSARYETCGFDVPQLKDITVDNTSKDGDDKGDYYADVKWNSHDSAENPGLPREYQLNSKDNTGGKCDQKDYDIHQGDKAGDAKNDADVTYHEYTYGQLVTTGATTINESDNKSVEIGYDLTAVYYYCVPENEAMKWNDGMSYTYTGNRGSSENGSAPEGFNVVEKESDPVNTQAQFDGDTTTGIDGVDAGQTLGETEIYTLSGVRVIGEPAPGIYIVRQGDKAVKTVIR